METQFELGQVVATPGVLALLEQCGQSPADFLARHAAGDWGDVPESDARLNDQALENGSRLLSAYSIADGQRIWVITDAADDEGRRWATTLLLPEDY